jgi:hypothetical protein
MFSVTDIFPPELTPYGFDAAAKRDYLMPRFNALTRHHYCACERYRRIVDRMFCGLPAGGYSRIEELPFLPVSLFKSQELRSVPPEAVFRVMTSSGTTGQQVSRVFLDKQTADLQARSLVKIMQHFLGKDRLPMVILDYPGVVRDRASFSARGAGILGLMQFGRQPIYALRDDMSFHEERVRAYLEQHAGLPVLFFGFTFMIWQHVIKPLQALGRALPASRGVLMHSGGWKKLEHAKVSVADFNRAVKDLMHVEQVRNFYGMVEQVGSVFFENDRQFLHTPVFADVIVRDPFTLQPLPHGETGLIQVLSVLPQSYPGHSLLTEDLGRLIGEDDAAAGMPGRFFEVIGRAPRSEARGCSDTYEQA